MPFSSTTEGRARRGLALALCLLVPAFAAAPSAGAAAPELLIGYVALKKDPRYTVKRTFARYLTEALGSPYVGARVAIEESKFVGSAVGVEFKLERRRAKSEGRLVKSALKLVDDGARYILVDAPAALVDEVARATKDTDVLLFNITARDDVLRQTQCGSHLLHVIPSHAMTTDALVQYLISKKWREALVLTGPRPEDEQLTAAFERSAKRFGVEIVERRPFVLSNDPREREKNNVALLTAGADYDVVFVADTDGEFARDVPYQTVAAAARGRARRAWPPPPGTGRGSATAPRNSRNASGRRPSVPCGTSGLGGVDGGEGGGRGGAAHRGRRLRSRARLPPRRRGRAGRIQGQPAELQAVEPAVCASPSCSSPTTGWWTVPRCGDTCTQTNNLDHARFRRTRHPCASSVNAVRPRAEPALHGCRAGNGPEGASR